MSDLHRILVGVKLAKGLAKHPELLLHATSRPELFVVSESSLLALHKHFIPHRYLEKISHAEEKVLVAYPTQAQLFAVPNARVLEEVRAHAVAKLPDSEKIQVLHLGRNVSVDAESFVLDQPGGRRSYVWKLLKEPKAMVQFPELFPRIRKALSDPDTKVILSLGAGGVRLFAHPTVMKFLSLLGLGSEIDEIWGSSGGAIAGLPYALGIAPQLIEQEGYHLYNNRYSFRLSPSKLDVLKNLVRDIFLPNADDKLKGFLDCQNALRELIGKYLSLDPDSGIPFYCVAYNLTLQRSEVLTPLKKIASDYMDPILHAEPIDAVLASSAIPILYVPKKILREGKEYLYIDGGATEEVPLLSPYRKWLIDRKSGREKRKNLLVFSVNLHPQVGSSQLFNHWLFKRLPISQLLRLSASYGDMIRNARIQEHKHQLARDSAVTQWQLTFPLSGTGIVNTKLIPKIIEIARESFLQQLLKLEEHLQQQAPRKKGKRRGA